MTKPQRKTSLQRGQRLTVYVERLAVGGRGVARHEGLVIFVALAVPDEEVEVELTFVKKNFAEARIIRIVRASPHRVTPPCPVANGICGGCNWQQVAYEEQLRQKRALVTESLKKFSGFADFEVAPTVPSPNAFRYRNRVQFHYSGEKLGFFKRGSHDIVDLNDCPITEELLTAQIPVLRREFAKSKPGRIEIFTTESGHVGRRGGSEIPDDNSDPTDLSSPFSQVNTGQNQNLVNSVLELVPKSATKVYDLYAGSGNFTFPIAKALPHSHVTAVELNAQSVRDGQIKSVEENVKIDFHCSDVMSYLQKASLAKGAVVLLDPPRVGCGPEVIQALVEQNPTLVIYISCHPATLARDLKPASDRGWKLKSVQPFDMFPQTDHVETVVVLEPSV